jgi:nitroreductase
MELFVQPEFASAPVIIWIAGNLAAACARLGALGHRLLLLRAGLAGHRLWTAALAMGLSGGITAGVVSGAAREQFGLDGYRQVSLLAFATGIEEGDRQESDETAVDEELE